MNVSRSASGSADVVEADLADRLGPADLAPDLVALLLAEGREVVVHRRRRPGSVDDRADVLALDVERPALGDLARAERGGQRVGGRVAAAQPAQVDDVPRRRSPTGRRRWSARASATAGRSAGAARIVA